MRNQSVSMHPTSSAIRSLLASKVTFSGNIDVADFSVKLTKSKRH